MFEITADDIARLDDETLRAVVARLCEAEVRQRGLSPVSVTWGGNQTAADGGIDVRVALPPGTTIDGFIPRAATGFQVKKQDMPRADILEEMRPDGTIRPSIQSLADQGGGYIIVSSDGSTADAVLKNRRDAMKEAMTDVLHADALALDFYDRTRIATWVRSHEGLIPWVRRLVGRPIPGWQSYGAWAHDGEYLLDDELRVHPGKPEKEHGFSALAGVQLLRDELRQERRVVRLVGLSGVGKTHLVQALFDDRIGTQSLNPDLAIYTNIADDPDPQPVGLAGNLIASGERAILVVDNCSSDLHQRLSEVCRDAKSRLSVLTIEYDIREDVPEGTEVFTLDSSSPDLIERLLQQRFPAVSHVDARAIAESSGGNARIAIALAETIERNETVAGLSNDQLFQRLFLQRHAPDPALYLAAQACSLVYSFDGEDVSEQAELTLLGNLIGQTPAEMYRHVAELQRRDLVQQRGVWRAVLPHAIANQLAPVALQNILYGTIEKQLFGSERLMRSFSRRLSYLHTSKEAVSIAKSWLAVGGKLAGVAHLKELDTAMLHNVAPVAPAEVLAALERTLLRPDATNDAVECKKYLDLLRSIANDAVFFERCTTLMALILTAEEGNQQSRGTESFSSLFHLCLSGTHATVEQRLAVIKGLLAAADPKRRILGAKALRSVLETWHFLGTGTFEFGARSRDYGYWPQTNEEAQHWFREALNLTKALACSATPAANPARVALAESFRGLWDKAGVQEELAAACRAIGETGFWPEGWRAVRHTLRFDGKGLAPERLSALSVLEADLRPNGLVQKVRGVVFSTRLQGDDLDEYDDDTEKNFTARLARAEELVQDLGEEVARSDAELAELLPELLTSNGRLVSFGQGLCKGTLEVEQQWDRLTGALQTTLEGSRRPEVLIGFLRELRAKDAALASRLLDDAVEHETLAQYYPYLQVACDIEHDDVARLKRSLKAGKAPARTYTNLAYAADAIPAADVQELVLTIAAMESGYDVAIEIVYMRLHGVAQRKEEIPPELISAGRELLRQLRFTEKNDREDFRLGLIATSCLAGMEGASVVGEVGRKFKEAVRKYQTYARNHDDLLQGCFSAQPLVTLETLCGGTAEELAAGVRILKDVRARKDVLSSIPEGDLLDWCDANAKIRYPGLARSITITAGGGDAGPLQWTPMARRLLEKAPDKTAVVKQFISQFTPAGAWSGSLATILETHAKLLEDLNAYDDLAEFVAKQTAELHAEIERQRQAETARDRRRDERFE